MSVNPIRRRAVQAVVVAAMSLMVLGGCTSGQQTPGSYDGAEEEFIEGCETVAKSDNGEDGDAGQSDTTKISSPKTYCQCVFDQFSGEDGIEYSEFKEVQSRMQDEGGPLPDSFIEAYESCDPSESAGS